MVDVKNSKESSYLNPLEQGIAFDDVLLVPQYSEILPSEVNLVTKYIKIRYSF